MISVIIPAYRVSGQILNVVESIGPEVTQIVIVDDDCPEGSGLVVEEQCSDDRIRVIYNSSNLGVGGAVKNGYLAAMESSNAIFVKVDGDGQMNPEMIPKLVEPLVNHQADYSKGNRFTKFNNIKGMPLTRVLGNIILTFFSKLSSGYWNIFDPNNGFTAITREHFMLLPLEKISNSYFFESDMLFQLYLNRATVKDVPIDPIYGNEISNLKIHKVFFEFFFKHMRNFFRRIYYTYFLKEFSFISLEFLFSSVFLFLGFLIGTLAYFDARVDQGDMSVGTLVLVSILVISGFQMLISFFSADFKNIPKKNF